MNPTGVKGLGELGNVGTNAAVANAIWHATGIRIRNLPVRLEDIMTAHEGRGRDGASVREMSMADTTIKKVEASTSQEGRWVNAIQCR